MDLPAELLVPSW